MTQWDNFSLFSPISLKTKKIVASKNSVTLLFVLQSTILKLLYDIAIYNTGILNTTGMLNKHLKYMHICSQSQQMLCNSASHVIYTPPPDCTARHVIHLSPSSEVHFPLIYCVFQISKYIKKFERISGPGFRLFCVVTWKDIASSSLLENDSNAQKDLSFRSLLENNSSILLHR